MTAYYNEIDPYAAEWLRNLITAGHIAPGYVDERSIEDVKPYDIREFTQCHFFAGVGVWSYALRRAGWPDDRPVWTGSCPCQPFSAAGKAAGFDDERHLWPAWYHLITQREPGVVFGEQVASKDGLGWLDLVQTDLEGAGYASGAIDLCSAGVGAPHIRQRSWFVAERLDDPAYREPAGSVKDAESEAWDETRVRLPDSGRGADGLADSEREQRQRGRSGKTISEPSEEQRAKRLHTSSGLADSEYPIPPRGEPEQLNPPNGTGETIGLNASSQDAAGPPDPGPTNGIWRAADWLYCRDGKWRPVRPGSFPLANGAPSRVGRLRAYGNAINTEAATEFIRAYLELRP